MRIAFLTCATGLLLRQASVLAERGDKPSQKIQAASPPAAHNALSHLELTNTAVAFDDKGHARKQSANRAPSPSDKASETKGSLVKRTWSFRRKKAADGGETEEEKAANRKADLPKQEPGEEGWLHPTDAPSKDNLKTVFGNMAVQATTEKHQRKDGIDDQARQSDLKSWGELQQHSKDKREERYENRKNMLEEAAKPMKIEGHQQYKDFTSMVMSLPPEQVNQFMETAKDTIEKNEKANKLSYEYVDGLEHLAGAASDGYDKMAVAHQVGYDQYRGQLEEGRMDPDKPTRMVFPFGGNIVFKPNSADLYKFSEEAIKGLIPTVALAMQKYAGRHFTICIHAATNLQRGDVPDRRDLKQIEEQANQRPPDQQQKELPEQKAQDDAKEIKKLLDDRFDKMKGLIGNPLKEAVETKVRVMEHNVKNGSAEETQKNIEENNITVVDIADPSTNTRHFRDTNDALMPSGAVIIIAEEQSKPSTLKLDGEQHHADCKMSSFDKWEATRHYRHDFDPNALPISETALFFNGLPSNSHDGWKDKQSRITGGGRLAGDEVSKLVNYGDSTKLQSLKAVLDEATNEKIKLVKAAGTAREQTERGIKSRQAQG